MPGSGPLVAETLPIDSVQPHHSLFAARGLIRGIPRESHRTDRIGWLRAAVLGVNDGIVTTASLALGVAAAGQLTAR